MHIVRTLYALAGLVVIVAAYSRSQEVNTNVILNVAFGANGAARLSESRGRLIWRDSDLNSSLYNLKYFSGGEIFKLDSALGAVNAAIDGDVVAWNTDAEQLKMFDTRRWQTTLLDTCYNPDSLQPVSVEAGALAYARRKVGTGSVIAVHSTSGVADTTFDEGVWNLQPSIHSGEIVWVTAVSDSAGAPSNIVIYDGMGLRMLTHDSTHRNDHPLARDGQALWEHREGASVSVWMYTGDSTAAIASTSSPTEVLTGYDLSGGMAVVGITDTQKTISRIVTFNADSGSTTTYTDSNVISGVHIDNGMIVWRSGTGGAMMMKMMRAGSVVSLGDGDNPVVNDDIVAWTSGDAVEIRVPLTTLQLTNDGLNGWEQSRFKPIDGGNVVWGNYANAAHTRLFCYHGGVVTQLSDSAVERDFVMGNEGAVIWRSNFDTLLLYSGAGKPITLLDTMQVENMYLSGGTIGFNGFGVHAGNAPVQAWLYRLADSTLIQLTHEDTNSIRNSVTLCDGNSACWFRDSNGTTMMMFYDGKSVIRLSSDTVGFEFSYRNGVAAWSEHRNGVEQIMMYDTVSKSVRQLTFDSVGSTNPVTDGSAVAWWGALNTGKAVMYYSDISSGITSRVAHSPVPAFRWLWMSNRKIAWTSNGVVYVYDGTTISPFGSAAFSGEDFEPYVDREYLVFNHNISGGFAGQGNIYRETLHAHPDFDADRVRGVAPFAASFHSRSWEGVQSVSWDFGDGQASSDINPVHTYASPGTYSVSLTVVGPAGAEVERKSKLIRAFSSTSVTNAERSVPDQFKLEQNYPNPFNPSTSIAYDLPRRSEVSLKIYNVLGQVVNTLVEGLQDAGHKLVVWQAEVPSGVYFYRLTAGHFADTKKALIIR